MTFCSLNPNEEIRSAGKKVIPSHDFTKLNKSTEILKKAREESVDYRKETAQECELLKEMASKDGFEEGLSRFNTILLQLDQEIKVLREEYQKKIIPIALKAAKKIVGEELSLLPERVTDIVIQALKPVTQHHHIKIYANKADLDILEKNRPKIKKILENVENLTIQERLDVEPGGCIIETESGIINAQLENQWRALETAFKSFTQG